MMLFDGKQAVLRKGVLGVNTCLTA